MVNYTAFDYRERIERQTRSETHEFGFQAGNRRLGVSSGRNWPKHQVNALVILPTTRSPLRIPLISQAGFLAHAQVQKIALKRQCGILELDIECSSDTGYNHYEA